MLRSLIMIAGSKFKSMKDFGTYKEGKIASQDHGNNVWFRNIKIKKLYKFHQIQKWQLLKAVTFASNKIPYNQIATDWLW